MKKYILIMLIGLTGSIGLQAMQQNSKEQALGMFLKSDLMRKNVFLVSPRFGFQPEANNLEDICLQAVDRAKRDRINPMRARNIFTEALLNHIIYLEFRIYPGNPNYNEAKITCQTKYGQALNDLADQYFPA